MSNRAFVVLVDIYGFNPLEYVINEKKFPSGKEYTPNPEIVELVEQYFEEMAEDIDEFIIEHLPAFYNFTNIARKVIHMYEKSYPDKLIEIKW